MSNSSFSPYVVGFIGFGGVIVTLVFNSWQARRQRSDELAHDRQTIRSALIEELKVVLAGLVDSLEFDVDPRQDGQSVYLSTKPINYAYQTFLGRIGLLTQPEVEKVMLAYLKDETFRKNVRLYENEALAKGEFAFIEVDKLDAFYGTMRNLKPEIEAAISELEKARDVDGVN